MEKKRLWPTYIMLVVATSIWGSAFVVGKFVVESFEPTTVAFLRFFGAVFLLFPIMWLTEKERPAITKKDWGLFALLGLTGVAIYNVCFFLASKHAPVVKSSLFISTNPILIVLLSGLFLKEALTKRHIIGMIVALLGAIIIIANGDLSYFVELRFEAIDFILLCAVISWAVYSVLGKIVLKKFSSIVTTTYAVFFGTIFLFPFALAETSWQDIQQASGQAWLFILYLTVFVSVVSFIMYYQGIKQIGAAKASIFINVQPLAAVIMATLILREPFTLFHGIGAFFVLTGVYIATYVRSNKKGALNDRARKNNVGSS